MARGGLPNRLPGEDARVGAAGAWGVAESQTEIGQMNGPRLAQIRAAYRRRRVKRLMAKLDAHERAILTICGELLALVKPGGRLEAQVMAVLKSIN